MELNEALFGVAIIVIMLGVLIFVDKRLSQKGKLIVSFIAVLILSGMFISTLIERFTYTRLTITSLFIIVSFYSFYRRYNKYKKGLPID